MVDNNLLPYHFHESPLLNIYISNEILYVRLAVRGRTAKKECPNIDEDNEFLVYDIICKDISIIELTLPNGDFRFINTDVLDFCIDENNNGSLYMEDGYGFELLFKCKSFNANRLGVISIDELGKQRPIDKLSNSKWHKLPMKNK